MNGNYQIVLNESVRFIRETCCHLTFLLLQRRSSLSNIRVAVEAKEWKEIKVCQEVPSISHSFFVDDLIFFSDTTMQQAATMKKCMDCFYSISG